MTKETKEKNLGFLGFFKKIFRSFLENLQIFFLSLKVEPTCRASSFSSLPKTPRARAWDRAEPKLVPPL